MNCFISVLATYLLVACSSVASAAGAFGEQAADFPPGSFTDGGHYSVSDFKGKVLVLYFGCPICPRNRGSIPERNKIVEQFRDKPVKFLAITPAQMDECQGYASSTHLEMPCFADGLGVMQQRYGLTISLNNIWQIRVIDPTGKIVGYDMSPEAIQKVVADVKWNYKDDGYDPKLARIIDLLEWNQFAPAMTALRPYLKMKNKTGDSARALFDKVKANVGTEWASQADSAASDNKGKALDLYNKLAACFPDDELGKNATEALKKLKADKAAASEVAARGMLGQLYGVMSKANSQQKGQVMSFCQSISKKYPESAAAKEADALAKELETAQVVR